ncbi:MAG: hypothetical protein H7Y11_03545, partial [Armatimonadetes bacterium]|nr:hypothetical protein [Anaerolineae bacterium]
MQREMLRERAKVALGVVLVLMLIRVITPRSTSNNAAVVPTFAPGAVLNDPVFVPLA